MRGFAGADTLSGGAGNDLIYGNKDADDSSVEAVLTPCLAVSKRHSLWTFRRRSSL